MEFIFMLTRDDRTVDGALAAYRELAATDLQLVGFKDVGVTGDTLRALTDAIHDDGRTAFLEVVSTSRDDELRSIEAAIAAGVDYVLGGTQVDDALDLLAGTPLRYCPFPGTIEGHPSELKGSVEEIADHAAALTARSGVTGVDLLAYRHRGVDPPTLVRGRSRRRRARSSSPAVSTVKPASGRSPTAAHGHSPSAGPFSPARFQAHHPCRPRSSGPSTSLVAECLRSRSGWEGDAHGDSDRRHGLVLVDQATCHPDR